MHPTADNIKISNTNINYFRTSEKLPITFLITFPFEENLGSVIFLFLKMKNHETQIKNISTSYYFHIK